MCRLFFLAILCALTPSMWALDQSGQAWLEQADSLRQQGQDAAALDFLKSAEQQFRKSGEACWVARCAERRARVHLDWRNPGYAAEALAAALLAAASCPELADDAEGWRFSLAQAKLDLGARDEARWILANLVQTGSRAEGDLRFKHLAIESMARLAQMSLEEGAYEAAIEDFNRLALAHFDNDSPSKALDAWGWSAVCSGLAKNGAIEGWQRVVDHPEWKAMTVQERSTKAVGWSGLLLGAGALAPFDVLATWPWAAALECAPGAVDPLQEAKWALLRAKRHQRDHAAQALAASHQAELAARAISQRSVRETMLSEALRLRARILAGTGAHGPAYFALQEADSLQMAQGRADRARTGVFESEPWLTAIGDERTRMESERTVLWQWSAGGLVFLLLLMGVWTWRAQLRLSRLRGRLRQLQQHWLPGRQHQVHELALSGARLVEAAKGHALPGELKRDLDEFGRLAALCAQEMRHDPVDLKGLCLTLAEGHTAGGVLDWSLREEVPFQGDADQLRDFLTVLLSGMGMGSCRMAMHSRADGLAVTFDDFAERGWWRDAMSLFAGDREARHWSLVRLRCDRLGGQLELDCDATGARSLEVSLPVYSA